MMSKINYQKLLPASFLAFTLVFSFFYFLSSFHAAYSGDYDDLDIDGISPSKAAPGTWVKIWGNGKAEYDDHKRIEDLDKYIEITFPSESGRIVAQEGSWKSKWKSDFPWYDIDFEFEINVKVPEEAIDGDVKVEISHISSDSYFFEVIPPPITNFRATASEGSLGITLTWTKPSNPEFFKVLILRTPVQTRDSLLTFTPTDGDTYSVGEQIGYLTVVYNGSGESYADTEVAEDSTYYYRAFAYDNEYNYNTEVVYVGVGTNAVIPPDQVSNLEADARNNVVTLRWDYDDTDTDGTPSTWRILIVRSSDEAAIKDWTPTDGEDYDVGEHPSYTRWLVGRDGEIIEYTWPNTNITIIYDSSPNPSSNPTDGPFEGGTTYYYRAFAYDSEREYNLEEEIEKVALPNLTGIFPSSSTAESTIKVYVYGPSEILVVGQDSYYDHFSGVFPTISGSKSVNSDSVEYIYTDIKTRIGAKLYITVPQGAIDGNVYVEDADGNDSNKVWFDVLPPPQVENFRVESVVNNQVKLAWATPESAVEGVLIARSTDEALLRLWNPTDREPYEKEESYYLSINDGSITGTVYIVDDVSDSYTTVTDPNPELGVINYYRAFAHDEGYNYQTAEARADTGTFLPKITSIYPLANTAETQVDFGNETTLDVRIYGERFGDQQGTSGNVYFGNEQVDNILWWSSQEIVVRVPQGALDGYVYVEDENNNQSNYSPEPFDVLPPAQIQNFSAEKISDTAIELNWEYSTNYTPKGVLIARSTKEASLRGWQPNDGEKPSGDIYQDGQFTGITVIDNTSGTSITDNNLPAGLTFFYRAYSRDNGPNYNTSEVIQMATSDTTPPTVTFEPISRDWDDSNIDVDVYIYHSSGLSSTSYVWSNSTSTPASWTDFTISNGDTKTFTQSSDGEWYLHIKATSVNNTTTTPYSGLYKKDATPPSTPTLEAPADNTTVSTTTPTFSWKASSDPSPGSGMAGYDLYIEGVKKNSSTIETTSYSTTLSEGEYDWYVKARDKVGNYANSSTWTVQVTLPLTIESISPSSSKAKREITLLIKSPDGTTIESISFPAKQGGSEIEYTFSQSKSGNTITATVEVPQGAIDGLIRVEDKKDRAGEKSFVVLAPNQLWDFQAIKIGSEVKLNWKEPTDEADINTGTLIVRSTLEADLINSSLNSYLQDGYVNNSGSWIGPGSRVYVVYNSDGTSFTDNTINSNLTYYYRALAHDEGPNYNTSEVIVRADVDTELPTIDFEPTSRDWASSTINVNVSVYHSQDISSSFYAWSNSTSTPASGWNNLRSSNGTSAVAQSTDGTWYLHVIATSETLTTTREYSGPYKKDAADPTEFSLLSPPDDTIVLTTTQPTFSWEASSDALSGLYGYDLYLNDTLRKSVDSELTSTTLDEALPEGDYSWYVKAKDFAGNERKSRETWNIKIVQPLTIESISPLEGYATSWVAIGGENFDEIIDEVKFTAMEDGAKSTIAATIKDRSIDNMIKVEVPNGAIDGPIYVYDNDSTRMDESSDDFNVLPPKQVLNFIAIKHEDVEDTDDQVTLTWQFDKNVTYTYVPKALILRSTSSEELQAFPITDGIEYSGNPSGSIVVIADTSSEKTYDTMPPEGVNYHYRAVAHDQGPNYNPDPALSSTDSPAITNVYAPLGGRASEEIMIEGENFGEITGEVWFTNKNGNLISGNVTYWISRFIEVIIPQGAVTGPLYVQDSQGTWSNSYGLEVIPPKQAKDFSAVILPESEQIYLSWGYWLNFPDPLGTLIVKSESPISWIPESLEEPEGQNPPSGVEIIYYGSDKNFYDSYTDSEFGKTFYFRAYTYDGAPNFNTEEIATAEVYLDPNALKPTISVITPNHGIARTVITIEGTSFGNSQGEIWFTASPSGDATKDNHIVVPGDSYSSYLKFWSDTNIRVEVPQGVIDGRISVKANNGLLSDPVSFTVDPPSQISTLRLYKVSQNMIKLKWDIPQDPDSASYRGALIVMSTQEEVSFEPPEGQSYYDLSRYGELGVSDYTKVHYSMSSSGKPSVTYEITADINLPSRTTAYFRGYSHDHGPNYNTSLARTEVPGITLSNITPPEGRVGTLVTIEGFFRGGSSSFGVSFESTRGFVNGTIKSTSETKVEAYVPEGAVDGNVYVKDGTESWSNPFFFVVKGPQQADNFMATVESEGVRLSWNRYDWTGDNGITYTAATLITRSEALDALQLWTPDEGETYSEGQDFDMGGVDVEVVYNRRLASETSTLDDDIGVGTYYYRIFAHDGYGPNYTYDENIISIELTSANFTPSIESINPSGAYATTWVTIQGQNFYQDIEEVRFTEMSNYGAKTITKRADIVSQATGVLTVEVPNGAIDGPIEVKNNAGKVGTSSFDFTVWAPEAIKSFKAVRKEEGEMRLSWEYASPVPYTYDPEVLILGSTNEAELVSFLLEEGITYSGNPSGTIRIIADTSGTSALDNIPEGSIYYYRPVVHDAGPNYHHEIVLATAEAYPAVAPPILDLTVLLQGYNESDGDSDPSTQRVATVEVEFRSDASTAVLTLEGLTLNERGRITQEVIGLAEGEYYLVVRQVMSIEGEEKRVNHLGVMTEKIAFEAGEEIKVDLSDPSGLGRIDLYGAEDESYLKEEGDLRLWWGGDADGNGEVNAIDATYYTNDLLNQKINPTADFNGSGEVDIWDGEVLLQGYNKKSNIVKGSL